MILLVADTRRSRALHSSVAAALGDRFSLAQTEVIRALAAGRDPGGNAIVRL